MKFNRIIIIGNGFDLSHNLKTKYSDFIKDYYSKIKDSSFKDELLEFRIPGYLFNQMNSLKEITDHLSESLGSLSIMHPGMNLHFNRKLGVILHNYFFYEISKKSESKWVDIEADYFDKLIKIIDKGYTNQTFDEITKLNKEVDSIANKFEQYLIDNIKPEIHLKYNEKTDELFNNKIASNRSQFYDFLKEFPESYAKVVKEELEGSVFGDFMSMNFEDTLILNFNYTNTAIELYKRNLENFKVINIHGTLNEPKNPINLGFGDEMHARYSDIEESNENEYLRLMKSFAYSNTDNYRQLFDFIESNEFQVQIMGHSCGISDRTLLNAIFENENCKSIKVFYHKYGEQKDNYSDIVRSISRHFNNKLLMRNKVVNKTLCKELPQL
ncbi:AbiH family protein [Olleya sp. Bg11-27]|uniref:AbiH family protein n=1 Tax=Olleya sp. Bg11-27 TaxID=2058135 RepID=UPI0012FE4259|nr:AbiH family protein [Olleya sp. Bg11-27]